MAHKQIIYSYPRFRMRWYRLDVADVFQLKELLRSLYPSLPENYRNVCVNVYNDLSVFYNPRNTRFNKDE